MEGYVNSETCDFSKEYKALPVRKRINLIKIARNLLKIQITDKALMLTGVSVSPVNETKDSSMENINAV